jgi:hypothetical protein
MAIKIGSGGVQPAEFGVLLDRGVTTASLVHALL